MMDGRFENQTWEGGGARESGARTVRKTRKDQCGSEEASGRARGGKKWPKREGLSNVRGSTWRRRKG